MADGIAPGGDGPSGSGSGSGSGSSAAPGVMLSTGCAPYSPDIYTPFANYGPVSTGTPASYEWRGAQATYPDGMEDFRAYGPALPELVACGSNKHARGYLDVTEGCLTAVSEGGENHGQIQTTSTGYYRSFAVPYDVDHQRQVAWTDVGVEYRFYYSQWTGDASNPGFKAFARYLTEYDLYVGSWRRDGVIQIQKKQCGVYTILKRDATYGAPSPNTWHTIKFEAVGNELLLYLDGQLAMTTTDDSITTGTAGVRIDDADGAYIDDWRVYAP